MAIEVGIPYVFIGEDGTRAVLGNGDAAKNDPDWVGFLSPDDGISGLIDGGEQRGGVESRAGMDGGYDSPSLAAPRTGSVSGMIGSTDQATIVALGAKLARATRTADADGILTWQPTGQTSPRMIRFRRRSAPAYKGRRPKTFQFALSTRDHYAISTAEQSLTIDPTDAPGEAGILDPITDPITSPASALNGTVVNAGNAPTFPRFRIVGPARNPEIVNFTTGARIKLACTIEPGETLDVLPEHGLIMLNGVSPRFGFLVVRESTWFRLKPGANIVRLIDAGPPPLTYWTDEPTLTTRWRNAYE